MRRIWSTLFHPDHNIAGHNIPEKDILYCIVFIQDVIITDKIVIIENQNVHNSTKNMTPSWNGIVLYCCDYTYQFSTKYFSLHHVTYNKWWAWHLNSSAYNTITYLILKLRNNSSVIHHRNLTTSRAKTLVLSLSLIQKLRVGPKKRPIFCCSRLMKKRVMSKRKRKNWTQSCVSLLTCGDYQVPKPRFLAYYAHSFILPKKDWKFWKSAGVKGSGPKQKGDLNYSEEEVRTLDENSTIKSALLHS